MGNIMSRRLAPVAETRPSAAATGMTPSNSIRVLRDNQWSSTNRELKEQLLDDFEKLLESGDGADVEITVPNEAGGEVVESSHTKKAHKFFLMAHSPFFSKMFAKESEMAEAKTGKLVMKDLSPKGLDVFLHYIYTEKVLDGWVVVSEQVIKAAEKYELPKLKQLLMSAIIPERDVPEVEA